MSVVSPGHEDRHIERGTSAFRFTYNHVTQFQEPTVPVFLVEGRPKQVGAIPLSTRPKFHSPHSLMSNSPAQT